MDENESTDEDFITPASSLTELSKLQSENTDDITDLIANPSDINTETESDVGDAFRNNGENGQGCHTTTQKTLAVTSTGCTTTASELSTRLQSPIPCSKICRVDRTSKTDAQPCDSDDVHLNLYNKSADSSSEDAEKANSDNAPENAPRGINTIPNTSTGIQSSGHELLSLNLSNPLTKQSDTNSSEIHSDVIGACQSKHGGAVPKKLKATEGRSSNAENVTQTDVQLPAATSSKEPVAPVKRHRRGHSGPVGFDNEAAVTTDSTDTREGTQKKLGKWFGRGKKKPKKKRKVEDKRYGDYAESEDSDHNTSEKQSSSDTDRDDTEKGACSADQEHSLVCIPSLRDTNEKNLHGIFVLDYFATSEGNLQSKRKSNKTAQPGSENLTPENPEVCPKGEQSTGACDRPSEIVRVAEDLLSSNHFVSAKAVHRLERLFITYDQPCQNSKEKRTRRKDQDHLRIIQIIIRKLVSDQNDVESGHFRQHCNLLLFACCAFLSHLGPHTETTKKQLESMRDELRGNNRRCSTSLRTLFDELISAVKSADTLSDESCDHGAKSRYRVVQELKKKKKTWMKEANMVQLAQSCFSLMNEMAKRGRDPTTKKLSDEMHTVVQVVSKRGKKSKLHAIFVNFLVRGLVVLLWTCFNEGPTVTGRYLCDPFKLITEILRTVFQSVKNTHGQEVLDELYALLPHPSSEVRELVLEAMNDQEQSVVDFLLSNTEKQLKNAGFYIDDDRQPSAEGNKKRNCIWQETRWRGPDGQLLLGAMRIYCRSCLESRHSDKCQKTSASNESTQSSQRHPQNLRILRQLGQHPNFRQLWAYQTQPIPQFYITERFEDKLLLDVLINDRPPSSRLEYSTLLSAADQVRSAIQHLASHGIALCDLTTSNMICEDKVADGKIEIKIKIADLGLSHVFAAQRTGETSAIRPLRDPGPCPVRWMSPESLFEGRFSVASMLYAFGYFLNELFTRGCEPFSETNRGTDDILRLLFLHSPSVRPFQWPCIPDGVFELIRGCTEFSAEKRWSLETVQDKIESLKAFDPAPLLQESVTFPQINIDQEARNYLPERGIPRIVQSMVGNPNEYKNLVRSSWPTSPLVKVTEQEVQASDSLSIDTSEKTGQTIVKERLTTEFVKQVLPDLESAQFPSVTCWTCPPVTSKGQDDFYLQVREYQNSETLLEFAKRASPPIYICVYETLPDMLPTNTDPFQTRLPRLTCDELCEMCFRLAMEVHSLHEKNWIHCDLRCKNVLTRIKSKQVLFARIGRMMALKPSFSCGKVFRDSIRWAAPEVIHSGIYSKMSDIFSLVTTFFELFHVAHMCSTSQNPHHLSLYPLANVELDGVANVVQEGVLLPQPPRCPDELYNLICDGRNPDRQARPDISAVTDRLQKVCASLKVSASGSQQGMLRACYSLSELRNPEYGSSKRERVIRRFVKQIRKTFRREPEQEHAECYEIGYISERIKSLNGSRNPEEDLYERFEDRYENVDTPLVGETTSDLPSVREPPSLMKTPSEKKTPSCQPRSGPSDHLQNQRSAENSLQSKPKKSTIYLFPSENKKTPSCPLPPLPSDHCQHGRDKNSLTDEQYEEEDDPTENCLQSETVASSAGVFERQLLQLPSDDIEKEFYENAPAENPSLNASSSQREERVLDSMDHPERQEKAGAWNTPPHSDSTSNFFHCSEGHREKRKLTSWGDVVSPCHQCLQLARLDISAGPREPAVAAHEIYENDEPLYDNGCSSTEMASCPPAICISLSVGSVETYENISKTSDDDNDDHSIYEMYSSR